MEIKNNCKEITPYAVKLLQYKAKQLVGKVGFTADDLQDIQQTLITDLLTRLSNFDSRKASYNTFIARILDHKVAEIIESRKAAVRDYRQKTESLDAVPDDEETLTMYETISNDDYAIGANRTSRTEIDEHDLELDVTAILAQLPDEQREVCILLKQYNIAETARQLNVSRDTIYNVIRKIRTIFEKNGLKEYL